MLVSANDHGAVVDDSDVFASNLLAEHVGEEGGVTVDGVAVGRVEDVADDGSRDLRREDDGSLLGLYAGVRRGVAAFGELLRWPIAFGVSSFFAVRELEYQ